MSGASDNEPSASSIVEYLFTRHWFSREIAELPDREIDRLRSMVSEAVQQRIEPEKVYEAITLGFERTLGITVSSPPLASDLQIQLQSRIGRIKRGPGFIAVNPLLVSQQSLELAEVHNR